jgi:transcriptional regulator with XRE-family HTH domain
MKRLTLKEIGQLAGVSRATVSRVINNHPNISTEVRNRRFSQFFEMRDAEKSRVVAKLGEEDRAQMEKTLSRFGSLSREEREQAMQGFKKFAELSPAEQASFLRTADRWKAMSERDKELWRKVVASFHATRRAPIPTVEKPLGKQPALSATN